jgi:hypothetical protein
MTRAGFLQNLRRKGVEFVRPTTINKKTVFTVSLVMLATAGCGGDSSESDVSVSGRVADGYIKGATVCLDLDGDGACGTDEPTATSGSGGAFTIDGVSPAQREEHSIVAEVPDSAIDEDTNTNVGASYAMAGANGKHEFISPMTTLIKTRSETTPGFEPGELGNALAIALGLDPETDLFADYIADGSDVDLARAHKVAQGVAAVMAANYADVRAAASENGLDPAEFEAAIQRLVAKHATSSIDTILAAVEEAENSGQEYDPQGVANNISSMDTTNLGEKLAREQLNAQQTVVPVREIFEQGVSEFLVDGSSGYEQIRYVLDPDDEGKVRHRYAVYDGSSSSWGPKEDESGETKIYWDDGQWTDYTTKADLDVSFSDNGRGRLKWGPGDETSMQGSWVDLSGKEIEKILSESAYPDVTGLDGALFDTGAKGVRLSMSSAEDVYMIDYVDTGSCNYSFDVKGNCNVITDASGQAVKTFSDLLVGQGETGEFIETGTTGETIYLTLQGSDGDAAGTAIYRWDDEGKTYEVDWERRTLGNSTEVILVEKPASLRNVLSTSDTGYKLFAVRDGLVRDGDHIPEGSMDFESGVWLFNDPAMKDLLSSLGTGLSPFYSQ